MVYRRMKTSSHLDGLQAKVNALREVQVKGGEELRPFVGRMLMASVLDRAFKPLQGAARGDV